MSTVLSLKNPDLDLSIYRKAQHKESHVKWYNIGVISKIWTEENYCASDLDFQEINCKEREERKEMRERKKGLERHRQKRENRCNRSINNI